MGFRVRRAATAVALLVVLAGCGNDNVHSTAPRTTPSPARPDVGTCWAVPPKAAHDPHHWFDDSPQVPCRKPHNAETVVVPILTKPTVAEMKKMSNDVCWDAVRTYLGVDPEHWIPWGFRMSLPSRKQIADGASWMRCDAIFPAAWVSSLRSTTGSADGVAADPPADFWACLNKDPNTSEQPFVPCDKPHQYEETGKLAIMEGLKHYPSPARRAADAQRQCPRGIRDQDGNIAVTASWDPTLGKDGEIAGACFIFDKSGAPLSPRP